MARMDLNLVDTYATEALGKALAQAMSITLDSGVVYLWGELGAGKTTCVRALLRAAGVVGPVRSPTYTLVEEYPCGILHYIHIDLYRLRVPEELEDLGLRDYLRPGHRLLIEWPEKGGKHLPPADLELSFQYHHNSRRASVIARSSLGANWLVKLGIDNSLNPYVSNLT